MPWYLWVLKIAISAFCITAIMGAGIKLERGTGSRSGIPELLDGFFTGAVLLFMWEFFR